MSVEPPQSQWVLIRRRFCQHRLAVLALRTLLVVFLGALLAEVIAPNDPEARQVDLAYCPPQLPRWTPAAGLHAPVWRRSIDPVSLGSQYERDPQATIPLRFLAIGEPYRLLGLVPCRIHLLGVDTARQPDRQARFFLCGADRYGRDLFARILVGGRISLTAGLVAVITALGLGLLIGGISGYLGGWTDLLIQRLIEIINAFPQLPLWLALAAALPADLSAVGTYLAITLVLALLSWTGLARQVRGRILALREEDYCLAARLIGAGHARILWVHLMPGLTSHIIVSLTLAVPAMILGETALSFLGLGLRPPVVSWGVLLQDCLSLSVIAHHPWLMLPVLPIVLTVLAFNFLGDGMRDAADPYGQVR